MAQRGTIKDTTRNCSSTRYAKDMTSKNGFAQHDKKHDMNCHDTASQATRARKDSG
jgi:hypothetical protein